MQFLEYLGDKMRKIIKWIIIISIFVAFMGCTTAAYKGFELTQMQDRYRIKIYVGGLSTAETAELSAKKYIYDFMDKEHYSSYDIIDKMYNTIPTYYEYIVQFSR